MTSQDGMREFPATLTLGLIFGGRSGEHEVSVRSARAVYEAARQMGYQVVGVGITRQGRWVNLGDCAGFFLSGSPEVTAGSGEECFMLPDPAEKGLFLVESVLPVSSSSASARPAPVPCASRRVDLDVVFPVLHGTYGEDGSIQGFLELSGIPYVGAPVLASAVCMDKDTTKHILATHRIPCVPALCVERFEWQTKPDEVMARLSGIVRLPVFVKPSASGSSLGVTKVKALESLSAALDLAFLYDVKALIEPSQEGLMEVECSVLGNDEPVASVPGRILPRREFYDYQAKYITGDTELQIPAPLGPDLEQEVREIAVSAYKAIGCKGMARVDFFVDLVSGEVLVNELNTIPGFTSISMYPKLWEASGLSFPDLVKTLVELALHHQVASWKEVLVRDSD